MAGGASSGEDEEGITNINVVPLVDIMLVLLIIFMVTTEFVQEELKKNTIDLPPNIDLSLPKASTGVDTESALLALVINKDGEIFLDGKESDLTKVKAHIDGIKKERPGVPLQAVIAADERVSHGAVISVVDKVRLWGVDDFAINTRPQEIE